MTEKDIIDAIRENLPWLIKFFNWILSWLKNLKFPKHKEKIKRISRKKRAIFQDNLVSGLINWTRIEGNPQISNIRGKPPFNTSLLLEEIVESKRHSFVGANNINIKDGEVECDVYLERDALVNIVIRADSSWNIYYMVRLDSRNGCFNSILFDRGGKNWDFIKSASVNVNHDNWYHVKVRFKGRTLKLYVDNRLNVSVVDQKLTGYGGVGIFNEVKRVFVNNFTIRKL